MVYAFDTLGYSKRLRDGGIPPNQAEAHAEAARDFIMVELVTKTDLNVAADGLRRDIEGLRRDMDARIEKLSLQLTIRLGALMVAGIGALAVILRLH
ncbi:MAG: hypothetical protein HXX10_21150 [Rhodoplanes sp.]|uniref:hypothetical protein n=1 Tax=Rhodoplanes sp. TaxID=1968906 RepID=UPI0017CA53E6|nr:hypothetical protein [Rhodoplanes sp.]NVO16543.1 hypothetical protein [Rhodoplanes sp.]